MLAIEKLIDKAKSLTKDNDNIIFEGYLYRNTGAMNETYEHFFRFKGLWSTVSYHVELCFSDLELNQALKDTDSVPVFIEGSFRMAIESLIRKKDQR